MEKERSDISAGSRGNTDLAALLAGLGVEQRPGRFTFLTGEWPALRPSALATIAESEGTTLVVDVEHARAHGAPIEFEAARLTLTVWSSLEVVGLTAAVSAVLADAGIACNVLAGYRHDHLLVPAGQADQAIDLLRSLSRR
jgi:hypothetical protein